MAVSPAQRAVWDRRNPLRCGGTDMPPNILIIAKVVALVAVLSPLVRSFPLPFLPFIPGLDAVPGPLFRSALQVVFLAGTVCLLLNIAVRPMAILLGSVVLLAVLSSRPYFQNNRTFTALLLIMCGLTTAGQRPWMVRAQLVVVFAAAGFDKLMDEGWRVGAFMEAWFAADPYNHLGRLARMAPGLPISLAASWITIIGEIGLGAMALVPAAAPLVIWGLLAFEWGLYWQSFNTFGMFFYATTISALAFAAWPRESLAVIYDGDCAFCEKTRRFFDRLDFDRQFVWQTYQSGAGIPHGITDAMAQQSMWMVDGGRRLAGFRAIRRLVLLNPVSYLLLYTILAVIGQGRVFFLIITALLAAFAPFAAPIGDRVYRVVARNRHRLASDAHCAVPASRTEDVAAP